MEISLEVFLAGCISDGIVHKDILFGEHKKGLNPGVFSSFSKDTKNDRTYYLCFDYKKTPKKHILGLLSMILKGFKFSFVNGRQYSFSRDFIGPNEKVLVYAYRNGNTFFHFFISHSERGVSASEYLAKNHKKVIFENL
jgi:hypothetical protein